jgi:hypothetical protein
MNKRQFPSSAALLSAAAAPAFAGQPTRKQARAASPVIPTISGAIRRHNRGALDPAFDRLLAKHQVKFSEAYGVDSALITSVPAVTIKPTTGYDSRQHTLSGPTARRRPRLSACPAAKTPSPLQHTARKSASASR